MATYRHLKIVNNQFILSRLNYEKFLLLFELFVFRLLNFELNNCPVRDNIFIEKEIYPLTKSRRDDIEKDKSQ